MADGIRPIRPSEYEEFYEFLARAFEKTPWDYFRPFYENDPWMRDEFVRVIKRDGRFVCGVTVFDRTVWVAGRRLRMGGIGNVATASEERGKGLAGAVLEDCKELMRREGFDVSLLFAGPVPLYERHGWTKVDAQVHVFVSPASAGTADLTVRPVSWDHERFVVRELHAGFIPRVNWAVERNMAYWNGYVRGFKNRTCQIYGGFRGHRCVGYAMVDWDRKERLLWLKEFCWTEEGDIPAMLGGLVERFEPAKVKVSKTGAANPVLAALRSMSASVEVQQEKGFMVMDLRTGMDLAAEALVSGILYFPGDDF